MKIQFQVLVLFVNYITGSHRIVLNVGEIGKNDKKLYSAEGHTVNNANIGPNTLQGQEFNYSGSKEAITAAKVEVTDDDPSQPSFANASITKGGIGTNQMTITLGKLGFKGIAYNVTIWGHEIING